MPRSLEIRNTRDVKNDAIVKKLMKIQNDLIQRWNKVSQEQFQLTTIISGPQQFDDFKIRN